MENRTKSPTSRLVGETLWGAPEEVGSEYKETAPVSEQEQPNPFAVVLKRLMNERGLSQAGLARLMEEKGYPKTATRQTIMNAINKGEDITFPFVDFLARVALELPPEEDKELFDAARETKRI